MRTIEAASLSMQTLEQHMQTFRQQNNPVISPEAGMQASQDTSPVPLQDHNDQSWTGWIPKNPIKRIGLAMATAGAALLLTRAVSGMPDASSVIAASSTPDADKNTLTLRYDQVPGRVPKKEEDGEGPIVRVTITASPDLDVNNGTILTLSELTRRFPGSSNAEGKRVTDVIRITEPGEPFTPFEVTGYAQDLDTNDFGGVVEVRSNKTLEVVIWERGFTPLERGRILVQKTDIVPPEIPMASGSSR